MLRAEASPVVLKVWEKLEAHGEVRLPMACIDSSDEMWSALLTAMLLPGTKVRVCVPVYIPYDRLSSCGDVCLQGKDVV
jgi:hypothetical protein